MSFIKQFDQFGASFELGIDKKNTQLKSVIGGLSSIMLYGFQFGYLIYQIYIWQDNQILPAIYQTNSYNPNQQFDFQFDSMTLTFSSPINPFDKNNNILIPFTGKQNSLNGINPDLHFVNQTSRSIILNNIVLNANDTTQYQFMGFGICNEYYSNIFNITCAPNNTIDEFLFKNWLYINLNITLNQYNVQTKRIESYQKVQQLLLNLQVMTIVQLNFKTGIYNVQQGIVFAQTNEIQCLQSFDIKVLNQDQSDLNRAFSLSSPLTVSLTLEQQQTLTFIQYALLGDVLASAGSIISIVMQLSYLIQQINQFNLQNHLNDLIVSIYYPEFRKIQLKRNFINNITQITYENGQVGDEKIIKFYSKIEKLAQNKLNIINLIYEISRIQFILQSLQPRDIINQSHQLGITVPKNMKNKKIIEGNQRVSQVFPQDNISINQNSKINSKYNDILKQNEEEQDREIDQSIQSIIEGNFKQSNLKINQKNNSQQEQSPEKKVQILQKYDIKLISFRYNSEIID